MEVSGQFHAVSERAHRDPLDRKPDGTQSWFESGGEEKKSQPLPGVEPQSSRP